MKISQLNQISDDHHLKFLLMYGRLKSHSIKYSSWEVRNTLPGITRPWFSVQSNWKVPTLVYILRNEVHCRRKKLLGDAKKNAHNRPYRLGLGLAKKHFFFEESGAQCYKNDKKFCEISITYNLENFCETSLFLM